MIFVPISISTRARDFNGASRNILKSSNHALHDVRIFIDATLNFSAPVELLNTNFFTAPMHQELNLVVGLRCAIIVRVLYQQP